MKSVIFTANNFPNLRRGILALAGLCGLVGILIEHGTYPGEVAILVARILSFCAVLLFLTEQVLSLLNLGSFKKYLKERWPTFALSVLLILEITGVLLGRESTWLAAAMKKVHARDLTNAYLLVIQLYIVSVFAVQLPHMQQRFARWRLRPAMAFVLVFLVLIVLGSGLLMLPRATPDDQPIKLLDALFTSTSAVCVTGLVVRDTGSGFTTFGQVIILILIQLGGLGIMSLTAALSLLLGRGIGVRESSLLREVFHVPMMAEVGRMVRFIILMTLAIEAAGVGLLYRGLAGGASDGSDRLLLAVFHSISAFCNAGFSLFSDSLIGQAEKPLVMGTATGLLVVGGLGFGVVIQVWAWLRGRLLDPRNKKFRMDLHTNVVLRVSAGLLIGGTLLLVLLEWNHSLAGQPFALKMSQAFFQSATCRTAGFNTMDLSLMTPASLFLMIILMFIGGAPGSTAGGVKVTALAIVWANVRSVGAGLTRVRLGRWEIEQVQVQRSMLVLSGGLVVAAVAIFILLITEGQELLPLVFEVFSALGTVGLSLGVTAKLTVVGKLLIAVLMFVGRLGPLTLAASLVGRVAEPRIRFPKGRILIG
jgi:trk/ktr system potassium uptake protein